MNIGKALKEQRELKGLSQRQLAALCKTISYATISRLEAGKVVPSINTVLTIVKALKIDINILIK